MHFVFRIFTHFIDEIVFLSIFFAINPKPHSTHPPVGQFSSIERALDEEEAMQSLKQNSSSYTHLYCELHQPGTFHSPLRLSARRWII